MRGPPNCSARCRAISDKAGPLWHDCRCMLNNQTLSIRADARRAFGPHRTNGLEPLLEHGPKAPWPRVRHRADLVRQAELAEDRNRFTAFRLEAAIRQPHVEVENSRRGRK